MTCFWDAIISSLNKEDFTILGQSNKPSIKDFIKLLLFKNVKVDNVKWNDKILTQKEIDASVLLNAVNPESTNALLPLNTPDAPNLPEALKVTLLFAPL